MVQNDTERRIATVSKKLNGLQLNKIQKLKLAQEIDQLAVILIESYKLQKVKRQ